MGTSGPIVVPPSDGRLVVPDDVRMDPPELREHCLLIAVPKLRAIFWEMMCEMNGVVDFNCVRTDHLVEPFLIIPIVSWNDVRSAQIIRSCRASAEQRRAELEVEGVVAQLDLGLQR